MQVPQKLASESIIVKIYNWADQW